MKFITLHFRNSGKPIIVDVEKILSIHESLSEFEPGTVVSLSSDDYFLVVEKPEQILKIIEEETNDDIK